MSKLFRKIPEISKLFRNDYLEKMEIYTPETKGPRISSIFMIIIQPHYFDNYAQKMSLHFEVLQI